MRSIRRATRHGVRAHEISPEQAKAELDEQSWKIDYWPLDRRPTTRAERAAHLLCDL
jgi:hypothetical protein